MSGYAGTAARYDALMRSQRKDAPVSTWSQQTALIEAKRAVSDIEGNLATERAFLQQSLQETPPGKDANVDAMRTQLQNLIDLQQAMVNRVVFQEGAIPPPYDRCISALSFAITSCGPDGLLTKAGIAQHTVSLNSPFQTNAITNGNVQDIEKYGSPKDVKATLTTRENDFANATIQGAKTCGI